VDAAPRPARELCDLYVYAAVAVALVGWSTLNALNRRGDHIHIHIGMYIIRVHCVVVGVGVRC